MATKSHVTLRGSKRAKDPNAVKVRDADPKQIIDVTIGIRGPKMPDPEEFVGQKLSPAELTERYGAKKSDADAVAKSLKAFGLKVDSVSLGTRSMRVSGPIEAMEAAFKPGLKIMRSSAQGEYRGRSGALQIPAELKGVVTGVFGLDERRMARRKKKKLAHAGFVNAVTPLSPSDIEQWYNFPPGDGSGQSIAIAEFGGGYFADDVATYCNKFQRALPNIQAVSVDAPAYTLQQILALPAAQRKEELGASVEVMMDVEIIAGLCPQANISVYFSTFDQQGWIDLLNAVIASAPVALSVSWGLAEDDPGWSGNTVSAINDGLNAASSGSYRVRFIW